MTVQEQRDSDYANDIISDCMSGDNEADHSKADHALVKLLRELGYNRTVEAWNKVGKWYA